jgi:hypothetical protein
MGQSNTEQLREAAARYITTLDTADKSRINEAITSLAAALQEYQASNQEDALTPRERLIRRAFELHDYEIDAVLEYIDRLEDIADIVLSEAAKDEVGIPFDEAIKELGFDRAQLEKIARDEGWMK